MHCKAHQKGVTAHERGNATADWEAKRAAEAEESKIQPLIPDGKIQIQQSKIEPKYSKEDKKLIQDLGGKAEETKWAKTPQGKLVTPSSILWALILAEHKKTHWGVEALYKYLSQNITAWNLYTTVRQVTQQCEICLQNNPGTHGRIQLG